MKRRIAMAACCCLFVLGRWTLPAMGQQELPGDCQAAMSIRSPQGQVDMFTRCLESGQVSGSAKATTLKQRAIAYMHLGQHQRAVDDIDEAVRIRPGDADNYYLRGVALRALGKLDRALEDTNRAIGIEPDNAGAYANRAYIYKSLGNASQAKADAQRARELDSSVRVPAF